MYAYIVIKPRELRDRERRKRYNIGRWNKKVYFMYAYIIVTRRELRKKEEQKQFHT